MKTIARTYDGANDMYLDSTGQIAMTSSDKDLQQNLIISSMCTLLGELQLDTNIGIPYFETVFTSPTMINGWKSACRSRLRKFTWLSAITKFDTTLTDGILRFNMDIQTADGEQNTIVFDTSASPIIRPGGGDGGGSGDDEMQNLIDVNGVFYLPVDKLNGVQRYRKMAQVVDPSSGVTTELSDQLYIKNENGDFVIQQ